MNTALSTGFSSSVTSPRPLSPIKEESDRVEIMEEIEGDEKQSMDDILEEELKELKE
jgi:hypothetical protein